MLSERFQREHQLTLVGPNETAAPQTITLPLADCTQLIAPKQPALEGVELSPEKELSP